MQAERPAAGWGLSEEGGQWWEGHPTFRERSAPTGERKWHQLYQEQGILLGEDKRLPDVTPPLRLRTEVSGVEVRGRGGSVERTMEGNRQGLWLSS